MQIWCLLLFYIKNCLLLFYLCKCLLLFYLCNWLLLFYLCNCLLLFYLWNWCLLLFYLWNCLLLFSACETAYFYTTCETAYFSSTLEWCLLFSSTCAMCIFSIFYLLTFLLACLSKICFLFYVPVKWSAVVLAPVDVSRNDPGKAVPGNQEPPVWHHYGHLGKKAQE